MKDLLVAMCIGIVGLWAGVGVIVGAGFILQFLSEVGVPDWCLAITVIGAFIGFVLWVTEI